MFDEGVFIVDCFCPDLAFPADQLAIQAIDQNLFITDDDHDQAYLRKLESIQTSILTFKPELIIYSAGTDILEGDPGSQLIITGEGIVKRDEMVFEMAVKNKVPILMLLADGNNPEVISSSIQNLKRK